MRSTLSELRNQFGRVYLTTLPDGTYVPWNPLSIGDYIKYDSDIRRGHLLFASVEDEIFKKCVVDPYLVRNITTLKAGTVSTVVANIWSCSGPASPQILANDLEAARAYISDPETQILHEIAKIILMAIPAYKVEDIYSMEYEQFMKCFALAENKLLQEGLISEPLKITFGTETEPKRNNGKEILKNLAKKETEKKQPIDAKKAWDEQQKNRDISPSTINKPQPKSNKSSSPIKEYKISPILEEKPTHGINFKQEAKEQRQFGLSGHEKEEQMLAQKKLQEDAQIIYKDVIAELAKRKAEKG